MYFIPFPIFSHNPLAHMIKLQRQYKQCNRQNKHRDYRRFTPFTNSFDKFKRGSPTLTNIHSIWILKAFCAPHPKCLWLLWFLPDLIRFKGYATRLLILNNNRYRLLLPKYKRCCFGKRTYKIGKKSRRLFSSFFFQYFLSFFDIKRKLRF
jgi:hypothetical protein